MVRKTGEQDERRERPRQGGEAPPPPGPDGKKRRRPRGALFRGDDPTLAKRAEEELYASFGR
jgi:hypothetical protein